MSEQKITAALDIIAKHYVVGCVGYYEGLRPDPWDENFTSLEQQLKSPLHFGMANFNRFAQRALELIERYKREGTPATKITNADAFHLGSEEALAAAESRLYKQCRACETKKGLRMFKLAANPSQVELLCEACASKEKEKRR